MLAGAQLCGPVVIYDDDHSYMANMLAAHLAERGVSVHLVTPQASLAPWMALTLEQSRVVAQLHALGVAMSPNAAAVTWEEGALSLVRSDTGEALPHVQARTLLSVTARLPDQSLSSDLDARGIAHRLIGDMEVPGLIQAAVYSGHRPARELLGQELVPGGFRRERPTLFHADAS